MARWLLVPLVLVSVVVEPVWRYRVHRWEITEDAVYTLEGWLSRTWRIVPVSRIQTVDTTRGPLQQLLGLASISVRTASHAGSTGIEHLDAATAQAVAHDLGLRANTVRDEATCERVIRRSGRRRSGGGSTRGRWWPGCSPCPRCAGTGGWSSRWWPCSGCRAASGCSGWPACCC